MKAHTASLMLKTFDVPVKSYIEGNSEVDGIVEVNDNVHVQITETGHFMVCRESKGDFYFSPARKNILDAVADITKALGEK